MRVHVTPGAVVVRFGKRFAVTEAERVAETLSTFAAVADITLDFSEVRQFEEAAFGPVARALTAKDDARLSVRGLSRHQLRMLEYLGVARARLAASRGRDGKGNGA